MVGLSKAGALLRATAPTLGLSAPSVSLTNRSGGNEHSPAQGASSADLLLWYGQRCLSSNASSLVVTGGGVGGIACRLHSLGNLQVAVAANRAVEDLALQRQQIAYQQVLQQRCGLEVVVPQDRILHALHPDHGLANALQGITGDHQFARCWPLVAQADGIFRRRVDAVVENQRTAQFGGVDGAQLAVGDEVVLDQQR